MADSPIPVGETLAGKYRIERVIGEGGMGVVVAAHHLELEHTVAIKFLLQGVAENAEGAERFRREARAAAKIHSDHVVRVLDVGVMKDGIRYMVMEYLEGRDLSEELAELGKLPYGRACGIVLEALDAVGHAHKVGIVHRDLKPANLYIAQRHDGSERVKVLDFGISKRVGETTANQLSLTKTSAWIGSPLYMAPEQMQSARDVDERADVWSLGAILYEAICGRPPYLAESLPQLCNLLITTDPVSLAERAPGVPSDLVDAVMGCLVRDPSQRIPTAAELARRIARYATTATGSGVRMSFAMLDVTEVQSGPIPSNMVTTPAHSTASPSTAQPMAPSVPASLAGSSPAPGSMAFAPLNADDVAAAKTHAAWGATGPVPAEKRGGSFKWIGVGLVVLLAGAGGYFSLMKSGADQEPAQEAAMVAAPATAEPVTPEPAPAPETEVAPDPKEASEGSASESEPPSEPTEKAAPVRKPAWKPRAPRPAVVRRPAPAPAPTPVAEPAPVAAPAPAPAPASRDSLADFGGRR